MDDAYFDVKTANKLILTLTKEIAWMEDIVAADNLSCLKMRSTLLSK